MAAKPAVCPVVGSSQTLLPPNHPEFDMDKPGQVCPVVNASTDHHQNLSRHPGISNAGSQDITNAASCPALKTMASEPDAEAKDEAVCPVVGLVPSVLPPDHPSTADSKEGDVCPKTLATFSHHKGKIHNHPSVESAPKGAVCPVVGAAKN